MRPVNLLCLLLFFTICATTAFSQAERVFLLDAKGNETESSKKAKLLIREKKVSDTCWQRDTYNFSGPLIKTERFKDKDHATPHGRFTYYTKDGLFDSASSFLNGQPHGKWYYWNDTGRVYLQKEYNMGVLVATIDMIKKAEEDKLKIDTTKKRVEKESEFPGGEASWKKYLEKNLKYPDRALKVNAKGEVRVRFIVDKDGSLSDIEISRSVEFSIDEEAMRIIRKSPKWTPATLDGEVAKSYKIQPLTFYFSYK